jgi:lysophospholipase L1-like esterase
VARRLSAVVGCLLVVTACAGPASPRSAPSTRPAVTRSTTPRPLVGSYLAVGDSYAAGVGLPPYLPGGESCGRSRHGYPALVAAALPDLRLVDRACVAATIPDVVSQLAPTPAGTTLVTVTVGGNDIGFAELAAVCLTDPDCPSRFPGLGARLRALGPRIRSLATEVASAAPRALVLLVGYPRLFVPAPRASCSGFTPAQQRWANRVVAALDAAVAAGAGATGTHRVRVVDVYDLFAGHEMCAPQPDVNGLDLLDPTGSLHPTVAGAAALARAVVRVAGPALRAAA